MWSGTQDGSVSCVPILFHIIFRYGIVLWSYIGQGEIYLICSLNAEKSIRIILMWIFITLSYPPLKVSDIVIQRKEWIGRKKNINWFLYAFYSYCLSFVVFFCVRKRGNSSCKNISSFPVWQQNHTTDELKTRFLL